MVVKKKKKRQSRISDPNRSVELSEEEIRGIYARGEGAVVSLVTQLLERLKSLEKEIKELQGRLSKDSHNSRKLPSSDGWGEVGTVFHPELTGRENIYLNGAILGMS